MLPIHAKRSTIDPTIGHTYVGLLHYLEKKHLYEAVGEKAAANALADQKKISVNRAIQVIIVQSNTENDLYILETVITTWKYYKTSRKKCNSPCYLHMPSIKNEIKRFSVKTEVHPNVLVKSLFVNNGEVRRLKPFNPNNLLQKFN